jgi:PadR family transcriptional regulator PadR
MYLPASGNHRVGPAAAVLPGPRDAVLADLAKSADRHSPQTVAVLTALVENPEAWRYGYELCQQVGLRARSMYPILIRLTDRGLLETRWETDPAPGRPPRHLYRLTNQGHELAQAARAAEPTPLRLRPHLEGA